MDIGLENLKNGGAMKRIGTKYPGVFYRESRRVGKKGTEKIYYILFKKDGKGFEEKVGRQYADDMTPSRAAGIRAERIEGKRESRKEIREKKKEKVWTFNALWEAYLLSKNELKGIVTDKNRYENYIKKPFGNKKPEDVSIFEVDRIRLTLLKTKQPGTVKNVLELLRRLNNYGIKNNLCKGIPFKIQMPNVDNERTEDLTPEQLKNLLKVIDEDTHLYAGNIMKMALFTGMRRGELFKLKWENIDTKNNLIHLEKPKGGKSQIIPLSEAAKGVLNNCIKTDSDYVFPGRNGEKRIDIKKAVNAIKKKAELPRDFRALHGLRHVYASMLASSGQVDIYTLQKLLTHKSGLMTQRYAHLRDQRLKDASDVMSSLINDIKNAEVIEDERQSS